jgi:hypothetical protein
MAFAVGKYSEAICDRCGFQYKYLVAYWFAQSVMSQNIHN